MSKGVTNTTLRTPSESKNILEKEQTEKRPYRDAALIGKNQEHEENNTCQERERQETVQEPRRKKKKKTIMISG